MNTCNDELFQLEALASSKLELLNFVAESMNSFLEEISKEDIDIIDGYISKHQDCFDRIDVIDQQFSLSLHKLDDKKIAVIKGFFATTPNKQDPPVWSIKLFNYMKDQQKTLSTIATRNQQILHKMQVLSLNTKNQLIMIKQKKDIQTNYPSFQSEQTGNILDIKEI